jgi:hypothetical protein
LNAAGNPSERDFLRVILELPRDQAVLRFAAQTINDQNTALHFNLNTEIV